MKVLVIVEGRDPTGLLLADATARLGHVTSLADLRRSRFEVRTGSAPHVLLDGETLDADVVVNRTSVNGLGLAPPAALQRQVASTWYEAHSAAREEQGLLLAVLDGLSLDGVRVINAPEAIEFESMRNLVVERLARRDVAVTASDVPDVSYLVTGGRVALQPGQDRPTAEVLAICKLVSEIAAFDLGEVRFLSSDGRQWLSGWTSQPQLTHLDVSTARAMAESLMEELVGRVGAETDPAGRPFIRDMIERFEQN